MLGIWEIKFNRKRESNRMETVDTRRVFKRADTKGFLQAAKWADDHCGSDEIVGSITLIDTERL